MSILEFTMIIFAIVALYNAIVASYNVIRLEKIYTLTFDAFHEVQELQGLVKHVELELKSSVAQGKSEINTQLNRVDEIGSKLEEVHDTLSKMKAKVESETLKLNKNYEKTFSKLATDVWQLARLIDDPLKDQVQLKDKATYLKEVLPETKPKKRGRPPKANKEKQ
jgi:biopolymer transport protein ExbB/TolQ